jgi:hypothetical protein
MAHRSRWRWPPNPSRMSSPRTREPTVLSSCMLITKTVALTSAQKTAMISIPSHVSELSKVRSLCLAWRREGPCHSTTQRGQEPSDRKDGRSPASGLGAVAG